MTCWFQCWEHSLSLSQSVCAIDVKKDGSVLGENQLLRFYDCFSLLIGLGHLHCHYCRNCPRENSRLDSFDKVSFFLGWVYLYKCVKSFFISGFGYLKTNTELLTRRWPQSTDIINWTISNLKSRSARTS